MASSIPSAWTKASSSKVPAHWHTPAGGPTPPHWGKPTGGATKSKGGGFLHSLEHDVLTPFNVLGRTGRGLASDAYNFPAGVYQMGKADYHAIGSTIHHPFVSPKTFKEMWAHPERPIPGTANTPAVTEQLHGLRKSFQESFTHPLRHPDQSLLNYLMILSVGAKVLPKAAGERAVGGVNLQPSRNPLVRNIQAGYDATLNRALANKPGGKIAAHAGRRMGGALEEQLRRQTEMRAAPAQALLRSGKALNKVEQAALRMTQENTTPAERIAFHQTQLDRGIAPASQRAQIKLLRQVEARHLVTKNAAGDVVIDETLHPRLAAIDQQLAKGSAERDAIIKDTGQMSAEGLATRVNQPAEHIVGFGQARPGRGYVPYYTSEAKAPAGAVARTPGPVVGKVRGIVPKKEFTGEGLVHGLVPDNTTRLVASQMTRAYRYASSDQFRRTVVEKTGSPTRRSARDVLVNEQELANAKVPAEIHAMLGQKALTLNELEGHQSAFDAWRQRIIPGLGNDFAHDNAAGVGTAAPKGYKWVDRGVLGSLAKPGSNFRGGRFARLADQINSAQTAATVYYKLGHIATRYGTNAVTNILQGSATPAGIAKSVALFRSLTPEERIKALAAVGGGGFHALPQEGTTIISRAARAGASFWAHRSDAPFRFNSIAYEARKAGYDTPAKFRSLLKDLESKDPSPRANEVASRANREAIAYNRLSDIEKRYLTRYFWFYPWLQGSSRFAGNLLLEHPFKAASLAALGAAGTRNQQAQLGELPSYMGGVFKTGGSQDLARIMNLNTVNPFATPAELALAAAAFNHPTETEQLSTHLNPALAAASRVMFNLDEYGRPAVSGSTLGHVAGGFAGSTPFWAFYQAMQAAKHPPAKPTLYMPNSYDAILRMLIGSVAPRTLDVPVANSRAGLEKKRR